MMQTFETELVRRFSSIKEFLGDDKAVNKVLPLVSVCVATYNQQDYIGQCLDGILMQKTDFPYEIIVGEDESSDNTREICKRYAEEHQDKIRLFLRDRKESHFVNPDGTTSRFNGLWNRMSCRGKYIAFCEGDDYWTDPMKLQMQVDIMEKNPEVGFVHTDFEMSEGKVGHSKWPTEPIVATDLLLNAECHIGSLTMMYRRDLFEKIPKLYYQQHFKMGDLPMQIEMSRECKFQYINKITAVYRVLQNSASHNSDIQKEIDFYKSARECRQFYANQYGVKLKDDDRQMYLYIMKSVYGRKDKALARKYRAEAKQNKALSAATRLFYCGTMTKVGDLLLKLAYKFV